jgi:protein-S-isoprenylcysteine O-methyltransferase Ste14
MYETVAAIVFASWVAVAIVFAVNHFRIVQRRNTNTTAEGNRRVARYSMVGLLLEAAAVFLVFAWPDKRPQLDIWPFYLPVILAPSAVATVAAAVNHLDIQWRIQAVVTESHQLIRSGPYALLRHPIYAALLWLIVATGIVVTGWRITLIAAIVYIAGTEIRVRAEDSLLAARFGSEFEAYRQSVKA